MIAHILAFAFLGTSVESLLEENNRLLKNIHHEVTELRRTMEFDIIKDNFVFTEEPEDDVSLFEDILVIPG
jgi:hypothetical protein